MSCRDANGFALHLAHENHLRRQAEEEAKGSVRDKATRYYADDFSEAFERSFLRHLVTNKLGQRVRAHEAYRALNPDDRQHDVMKKTCWGTLGRFVADLRDRGEVEAWRDDDGWIVTVLEGFPSCEWALLPDHEAKKIHSRLDQNDQGPVRWQDVSRLGDHKKRRVELEDDAFKRADRVAAEGYDEKSPGALPESRRPIQLASLAPKKPRTDKIVTTTTWLRVGLIVKAMAGKSFRQANFDRVKCRVIAILLPTTARVERLDTKDTAELDQSVLETVLPAIGKRVRILAGPHAGKLATLKAIHVDRFSASVVTLHDGISLENLSYEHICKDVSSDS